MSEKNKIEELKRTIADGIEKQLQIKIMIPRSQWRPIVLVPCDLCSFPATWEHPDGRFRCDQCPRPER